MGLVSKIKQDVKKSGSNKGKLFFIRDGEKGRVRFLQDMDDGYEFVFHDSFERSINTVCREEFGESCPYCDDEVLRTRSQYAWSVWDYEAKEVKIFLYPVNQNSPVPSMMGLYDTYGTMIDRDYVISVQGKQMNKAFTVVPMDKVKFRNDKAKPLSKKAMLKILNKAFPMEAEDANEPDEDEVSDYDEMDAKELYKLCKERDIECKPKKNKKYYVGLLIEDDQANDDWDDEDDSDEDDKGYAAVSKDKDDSGIDDEDDWDDEDDD